MTTYLLVALGASVGAPVRYLVDRWVQQRLVPVFPWGTFGVNVVGSLFLGGLAAAASHDSLSTAGLALLGAGFCGGLTTFSSFGWETHRLLEDGADWVAMVNVAATTVACLGGAAVTWTATTLVLG
jgi:fluoride exporter